MLEINGVKYNKANIAYVYKKDTEDKYLLIYVSLSGAEIVVEYDSESGRNTAYDAVTF